MSSWSTRPGASGAIGTQAVLDAPRDGLTWTANAIANNATIGQRPARRTDIDDWYVYLSVANAPLISVPADSEFQDFGQLLEAFRTCGEDITVATAGVTSSGGTAIAGLSQAGDFKYRMVAYDGGGPAAIATAAGEAMVTTQLAVERAELVRGGRLRPLAVMGDQALVVEGVDPVPTRHRLARHGSRPRLFRHLHPARRSRRGGRDDGPYLGRQGDAVRRAADLRRELRRGLRSFLRRRGARQGDADRDPRGLLGRRAPAPRRSASPSNPRNSARAARRA